MERTSNESLNLYLEILFNKKIELITADDLLMVEHVPIDNSKVGADKNSFDYSILKKFKNLKRVYIKNSTISNEDLEILINLKEIEMEMCTFENEEKIVDLKNLTKLSLSNCYIENYAFLNSLNNLEMLSIRSPYNNIPIDLKQISAKENLKKIILEKCNIYGEEVFSEFNQCESVSILWTKINTDKLGYLSKMPKLKELYISKEYLKNPMIEELSKRVTIKMNLNDFVWDNV